MFSAEARIQTDRASRYLIQLCRHTAHISGRRHGAGAAMATPRRAECSDTDGLIEFAGGRCTLRATGEELILLAEADDQQRLRLMQDAIAARVRQIGRRDQLSLTWRPGSAAPGRPD